MHESETFILTNETKGKLPSLPFVHIKESVLGKKYEASLTFVGPKKAKELNLLYRQKTYTPNVLSFPISKTSGEIIICPTIAKKEAHDFGRTYENFVGFLFIHGLLHLKGFDHGSRMEKAETKIRKKFRV